MKVHSPDEKKNHLNCRPAIVDEKVFYLVYSTFCGRSEAFSNLFYTVFKKYNQYFKKWNASMSQDFNLNSLRQHNRQHKMKGDVVFVVLF